MSDVADIISDLVDRYGQLEMERRLAEIESGERSRREVREAATLMRDLRARRMDPRFKAYIDRRARASKVTEKHYKFLLTAIVQSIGKGEQLVLQDFLERKAEGTEYTKRHVRDIQDKTMPDFFLPRERTEQGDTRQRVLQTVATPTDLPRTSTSDAAEEHLAMDALEALLDPRVVRGLPVAAVGPRVDPDRLERFDNFRDDLDKEVSNLERDLDLDGEGEDRLEQLKEDRNLRETLFNHLESILVFEWFRRLGKDRKLEELDHESGAFLQPSDHKRLSELVKSDVATTDVDPADLLETAHVVLLGEDLLPEASAVGRALLRRVDPEDLKAAILKDNIASCELRAGNLAEAATVYEDAVRLYREHGKPYREAVALTNLAEVQFRRDDPESYQATVTESERLLEEIDSDAERFGLLLNLATLRARVGRITEALEYLDKAGDQASSHEELGRITDLILHLTDTPDGQASKPGVLEWP